MSDQSLKLINNALEPVTPALGELLSYKLVLEGLKEKYLPITVKDITDVATMAEAKTALAEVKSINKQVEACRVKLKADHLTIIQSIDGTARIIRTELDAIVSHLEAQAKFAEIAEAKANEQRRQERSELLSQYPIDGEVVNTLNIGLYSDTEWTTYLAGIKSRYQDQEAAKVLEANKAIELEKKRKQELAKLKEQAETERAKREEIQAELVGLTNKIAMSTSTVTTFTDDETPFGLLNFLSKTVVKVMDNEMMTEYVDRLEPILRQIRKLEVEAMSKEED